MTVLPILETANPRRLHIHLVRQEDLAALYQRQLHHVFLRIQAIANDVGESNPATDHLGITVVEVAKCLPWIPANSIVVLACFGGWSPLLRLKLTNLHSDRELFLLDDAPAFSSSHQEPIQMVV